MKVKAAVASAYGAPLRLEGLELDEPQADEILVRLIASGVARVDLDAVDGRSGMPLPFVPGSEGAGIVERVGAEVVDIAAGDSVIVGFDFCGHCERCATGHPGACIHFSSLNLSGRRLDGSMPFRSDACPINGRFFGQSSFATHLICRGARAIRMASGAPLEILAALGGEVLMGAGTVLHGFQLGEGDSIVITGAGAIGLAATMAAKARGAGTIVVADADERRRDLASDLGAQVVVHGAGDVADVIRSLAGEGARFALESSGEAAAREACRASLMHGGTCAFIDPPDGIILDAEDQAAEGSPLVLSVDGHAAPSVLIEELMALRSKGLFPIEQMIDFFPFEHVNDALDALRRGSVAKPVLRFSLGGFGDLDRALVEGAAQDAPQDETVPDETEKARAGADQFVRS